MSSNLAEWYIAFLLDLHKLVSIQTQFLLDSLPNRNPEAVLHMRKTVHWVLALLLSFDGYTYSHVILYILANKFSSITQIETMITHNNKFWVKRLCHSYFNDNIVIIFLLEKLLGKNLAKNSYTSDTYTMPRYYLIWVLINALSDRSICRRFDWTPYFCSLKLILFQC